MMSAEHKIIERIAKLLELADEERGGTEAERQLATKRAQELMLKHNIAMNEVSGRSAEGDVGAVETTVEGSMAEWQVMLTLMLGRACFVEGYFRKLERFKWSVVQVGRPDNVAFVNTLCKHLIPWLEQEATVAFKEAHAEDPEGTKPRSFRRAFYNSATHIILARLEQQRAQSMGTVGTELVRNEDAANARWLEEHGIRLRRAKARGYGSAAGKRSGHQAGMRADLTPGRKLK